MRKALHIFCSEIWGCLLKLPFILLIVCPSVTKTVILANTSELSEACFLFLSYVPCNKTFWLIPQHFSLTLEFAYIGFDSSTTISRFFILRVCIFFHWRSLSAYDNNKEERVLHGQGHMVIYLDVIWKRLISWECMQNMWSLSLMVQKSWPRYTYFVPQTDRQAKYLICPNSILRAFIYLILYLIYCILCNSI